MNKTFLSLREFHRLQELCAKNQERDQLCVCVCVCVCVILFILGFSLAVERGGYSLTAVSGLLLAVAYLMEQRLQGTKSSVAATHGLSSCGSPALEHRLQSGGTQAQLLTQACGIFLDQGSNPCLLHWQAESLPLNHQGSPLSLMATIKLFDLLGCPQKQNKTKKQI